MEAMFANFESCGHYSSVMDFCWYIIWRIHELYIFVSFLEYRYAHVNYYTNQQVSLDHIFIQWVYFTKFSQKLQKYIYTINELRIKNLELLMNSNVWIKGNSNFELWTAICFLLWENSFPHLHSILLFRAQS